LLPIYRWPASHHHQSLPPITTPAAMDPRSILTMLVITMKQDLQCGHLLANTHPADPPPSQLG